MTVTLSICIPTFNRSECLKECLSAVLASVAGYEYEIEVVISDNASIDDTGSVVRAFQEKHPWIRYHRNEQNIGAERNFYLLAALAQGDNIWIFGDDDKMEASAVARVLGNIRAGYGLTICNYSIWDNQLAVQIKKMGLPGDQDQSFEDPNELLMRFGLHLGYISSVVFRRTLFIKQAIEEREFFVGYGWPFLFALYNGVAIERCKVGYIASPLLRNRSGNSGNYDWYKYFVTGTSIIFNELLYRGYTRSSVQAAKQRVLKECVVPNFTGRKLQVNEHNSKHMISLLFKHYKYNWQFWLYLLPISVAPSFVLRYAKKILEIFRRINSTLGKGSINGGR